MLLHYLGKLKDQKSALCMHAKHVSSVTFYHLSNRYLSNVMKISAKINTMQNNNNNAQLQCQWCPVGHRTAPQLSVLFWLTVYI